MAVYHGYDFRTDKVHQFETWDERDDWLMAKAEDRAPVGCKDVIVLKAKELVEAGKAEWPRVKVGGDPIHAR